MVDRIDRAFWPHLTLAVAAVVAAAVTMIVLTSTSGIIFDDWGNLVFMQEHGLTLDALVTPVFDHLAPGHRVLDYVQLQLGPLDTSTMFVLLSLANAAIVGVTVLAMWELYGRRWWVPLVALVPATGAIATDVVSWIASANHQVPAMLLSMTAVWQFLVWRRTRRTVSLILSVACLLVGLLFISRTLLAVGVILLLHYFVLEEGGWRAAGDRLRETWPLAALYLGLGVVYMAIVSETVLVRPLASLPDTLAGLRVGWLVRVVPGLFGLHPPYEPFVNLSAGWLLVVIVLQLLFLGLVGVQIARLPRTGRAVTAFVVIVITAGLMSVITRASMVGPIAGAANRYWYEALFYGALLLPFGFGRAGTSRYPWLDSAWWVAVAAPAILAVLVVNVWQASRLATELPQVAAARWTDALAQDVSELGTAEVIDDEMPERVGPLTWKISDIAPLVDGLAVTGAAHGFIVSPTGDLVEPEVDSIYEASGADFSRNPLVAVRGDVRRRQGSFCTDGTMEFELLMAPHEDKRYLSLALEGTGTITQELGVPPELDRPPPVAEYTIEPTRRRILAPMDLWDVPVMVWTVAAESGQLCVTKVEIVTMENDRRAS